MNAKLASLIAAVALATGCMRWSPFETDLSDDEKDRTAANLKWLAALPEPPARYRIGLLSDNHNYFDELGEVVEELDARDDLELVIHLGDFSAIGLREEFRWSLERLEQLDVPYFTAIGNHDALSNGKMIYVHMFGPYDYVVEHGDVRFVIFNSNALEFGPETPDLEWLDERTRPVAGKHIIAVTHQLPEGSVPAYDVVLRNNHVEALITGHHHDSGVSSLEGLPSFRVGSVKYLDYAILGVGAGPPEFETCFRSSCKPAGP